MDKNKDFESNLEEEDKELLRERCWQEGYKGASRDWLIRDASTKKFQIPAYSTMKESYLRLTESNNSRNMGKREQALLRKFREEAMSEIIKERETKTEIDDYCTEYEGNFHRDSFTTNDEFHTGMMEQIQKYPLYSSKPMSIYQFAVDRGTARTKDTFHKNSNFTKPLSEQLNDGPN
ncbi:hypothetical protein GWI33_019204 [Rhynchophorus ferrugineus]|uniref:Uncharacterized protein n=1 Tax=Rhynchophorus ferrugineus TaxID=354439 RepID=A0A834HUG3_RHYFE|nr:hypothetical protein GWI33_019204 [Rhynchophorus ferrugineus]